MKILLDNNVPRLLRNNLPGHQVEVAVQFGWHTLSNGELLDRAESEEFQLLITADQGIPTNRTCPAETSLSSSSLAIVGDT